ncbi:MAG: glycosyltransferase, partial [Dehalococcoidia bacterium]
MHKVTIGIITYNRLELSKKAIPQIVSNIGDIDAEIIVWDNNSQDDTVKWLNEFSELDNRITVIPCNENIGVEAFNEIVNILDSEFIIKVDNDILVPESFAEVMVDIYEYLDDSRLAYLGWDLKWVGDKTFALRREGHHYFRPPNGRIERYLPGVDVFICEKIEDYFMNGSCRLSKNSIF